VTGTGTLQGWDPALNGGAGGWSTRATAVSFTATVSQYRCSGTRTPNEDAFGLTLGFTPGPNDPPLPVGSEAAILSGKVRILAG
jgi:hypothetical protein